MVAILVPATTYDDAVKDLDKTTLRVFQQDALRMFTSLTGYRLEDDRSITHSSVDAWSYTPSVLMWSGYVQQFYGYAIRICEEWTNREYGKSTVSQKLDELFMVWMASPQIEHEIAVDKPAWLDDQNFIDAQRSRLVRQSHVHYRAVWPDTPRNLAVLWPQNFSDGTYAFRVSTSDQYEIDRGKLTVPAGTARAKMPPGYEAALATPTR